MGMQGRVDQKNFPFFTSGSTLVRDTEVIAQIGGRATVLACYTLMAQIAATGKWKPLSDVTATDGTATARGIYVGDDIPAATIAAGDVTGIIVVQGIGATFDSSQLVIENSVTLTTVVGGTTLAAHMVQDDLARIGIMPQSTLDFDVLEN